MAETYKQFDKDPIVSESDIVLKGFRFRKRELALGASVLVCVLVIVILAALLASANGGKGDSGASASASTQIQQDSCVTPACLHTAAHVTELLNSTPDANPCRDFHSFACGSFAALHPLGPDQSELTTSLLIYNDNEERIRRLLEKTSPSSTADNAYHYETKLRWFFDSCTEHYNKMQNQGVPLLQRVITPSGGWWALQGNETWSAASYNFQRQLEMVHVDFWTDAFFTFSVVTDWLDWQKATIQIDLSGLGMPYYYFYGTPYAKERDDYKSFIRSVGTLLLRDAQLNVSEAEKTHRVDTFVQDAYFVESELALIKSNASSTVNAHASDKRLKLSQLNAVSSGAMDWESLFKYMFNNVPVTSDTYVVVMEQEYVSKFLAWINDLDSSNKSRILNNYLVWRMAHRYAQDLSWDYIHANRQLYVDLTGQKNFLGHWRYCLNKLDRDMREALGALFVKDHFNEQNKETAMEITDYVKRALVDSLHSQYHWMAPATRQIAVTKIQESLMKLGYPNYMMNDNTLNQIYASLSISKEDYFGNLLSFNGFFREDWNRRLNNPNDRTVWAYATYSFVAEYYNPWKELIVPAGLLQFPIYDHRSPRYMNFGSMGSVVARQLTHAIDEIGNQYMLNGSHYGNWWSVNTTRQYQYVRNCIISAYRNYTMGPFDIPNMDQSFRVPVNTNYYAPLALGESSGIKLAYRAYKNWSKVTGGEKMMPGHMYTNDQMFFISYAQTFCANRSPYSALNVALRGTSVTENIRVNAALAQVKEFQQAFQCPASSNMVAPTHCSLY